MRIKNLNQAGFVKAVASEAARMSWPGRMSGILKDGTKQLVKDFFVERAGAPEWMRIWSDPDLPRHFDEWHKHRTRELAAFLTGEDQIKSTHGYRPEAVATKLLNTYFHQLMKYEQPRRCYHVLHLPLDQKIRKALLDELAGTRHKEAFQLLQENNPYALRYEQYARIQAALQEYCTELRGLTGMRRGWARIELNLLWASGA